jgi:pyruvate/2-oxoglutarate dehydrogenase complex dihydrolipoamide dehydrogenase (E3) component
MSHVHDVVVIGGGPGGSTTVNRWTRRGTGRSIASRLEW